MTKVRENGSNFATKIDNNFRTILGDLSTLKISLSFLFIFNMKIHYWNVPDERFDYILEISGGFRGYSNSEH